MDPGSNVVNIPDVGSVVTGVSAATVNHYREQLIACMSTREALAVRGHVQLQRKLEFANVLDRKILN